MDYVDASRNQVVLKMIPRIDYSRKRGVLRTLEEDKKGKKKAKRRPPAKLFDPDSVRYIKQPPHFYTATYVFQFSSK